MAAHVPECKQMESTVDRHVKRHLPMAAHVLSILKLGCACAKRFVDPCFEHRECGFALIVRQHVASIGNHDLRAANMLKHVGLRTTPNSDLESHNAFKATWNSAQIITYSQHVKAAALVATCVSGPADRT